METSPRRTRGALADLSRQLASVTVNLPSSLISPAPSPDEMAIRLRGRRKTPVTWSPESEITVQKLMRFEVTPPKSTPTRVMLGLRSSPRKRLQLTEVSKEIILTPSPEKQKRNSPNGKRQKLEGQFPSRGNFTTALKGLTHSQLVDLLQNLANAHPELTDELEAMLPEPDLKPMEDELIYLKKNIFKSLPNNRLTSKTDSPAYNRAAVHLGAFKKAVLEHGKQLLLAEQWESTIKYCFMAWDNVRSTPVWDNAPHNATRKQCFKALSSYCLQALKKGTWDSEKKQQFLPRLKRWQNDSDDATPCISFLLSSEVLAA